MATPRTKIIGRPFAFVNPLDVGLAQLLCALLVLAEAKESVRLATIAKEVDHLWIITKNNAFLLFGGLRQNGRPHSALQLADGKHLKLPWIWCATV